MNKKTLAIAILGTCVTGTSFAFNIFPNLKSTHANHTLNAKLVKAVTKQHADYTDFSGTWSGKCTMNGESDDTTMIIHNDGVSIDIDGQEFNIGSEKTETTSNKTYNFTEQTILNWNQERTQLILGGTMTEYQHTDFPYNNPQQLITILVSGNIALNDGQLNIKVEGNSFSGITPNDEKFTTECSLDKVK